MIWIFSILGDHAANVDITWYHWPCNIDITKNRFYMAARIDKIVISELAATDPLVLALWYNVLVNGQKMNVSSQR